MTSLNLSQKLLVVQGKVKYVQKDVTIPSAGKGVARDNVVAEVRQHLIDAGIFVSTSQQGPGVWHDSGRKSNSGSPIVSFSALYVTTFRDSESCGTDNTGHPIYETIEIKHEGHGLDNGDKAPGKASTYAEKLNLIKGLMLECGIDDESRNIEGAGPEPGPDGEPVKTAPSGIRTPKEKQQPKAVNAQTKETDTSGAPSPGLLKMFKLAAEAKGVLDKVEAALEKRGDKVTKAWVVKQLKNLSNTAEREPGSEG